MVITKGDFEYNGIRHTIGEKIRANEESDYEGLYGTLLEIRTDPDKDTDNEGPDFYCSFDMPNSDDAKKNMIGRFSRLYQKKVSPDDLALDEVIMAPDMLTIIS